MVACWLGRKIFTIGVQVKSHGYHFRRYRAWTWIFRSKHLSVVRSVCQLLGILRPKPVHAGLNWRRWWRDGSCLLLTRLRPARSKGLGHFPILSQSGFSRGNMLSLWSWRTFCPGSDPQIQIADKVPVSQWFMWFIMWKQFKGWQKKTYKKKKTTEKNPNRILHWLAANLDSLQERECNMMNVASLLSVVVVSDSQGCFSQENPPSVLISLEQNQVCDGRELWLTKS